MVATETVPRAQASVQRARELAALSRAIDNLPVDVAALLDMRLREVRWASPDYVTAGLRVKDELLQVLAGC